MEVKMIEVKSSNIISVGWAEDTLFVKYNSGVYVYSDVKREVFENLLRAESKGRFILESVKNKYQYKKLEEAKIK